MEASQRLLREMQTRDSSPVEMRRREREVPMVEGMPAYYERWVYRWKRIITLCRIAKTEATAVQVLLRVREAETRRQQALMDAYARATGTHRLPADYKAVPMAKRLPKPKPVAMPVEGASSNEIPWLTSTRRQQQCA